MESTVIGTVFIRSIKSKSKGGLERMEWLLKSILNPLEHLSILYKIRWNTHRILRAFQRRFTLNPKRFNINRHSNPIQKPSNLFHFGNI